MADRRMFSRNVVEADSFIELPAESQALYFHFALNADDDGFINCTKSLFRFLGFNYDDLQPLIDSGYLLAFPDDVYVITDWRRQNTVKSDRYVPTVHQTIMDQLQLDEKSKVYRRVNTSVPSRFQSGSNQDSKHGSDLETKERDNIGSIGNNKGNREKEREGSEVSFQNSNSRTASGNKTKSDGESKNERFVNGEYKPQLWECEIPKMFWGKFQYEDDYYAYAEEHRDEIIKMLDEMENAKGKQPA